MNFFLNRFNILLILFFKCVFKGSFCISSKIFGKSVDSFERNSEIDTVNKIKVSKAYYLVDPSHFWSLNSTTQLETKKPVSKTNFLIINAPSIGIESLIFIKNINKDGKEIFSHKVSSFITYTLICTSIGGREGWVLKQPAADLAFGFSLNKNNVDNYCQQLMPPNQVEKWYNSLNQHIRDMIVSELWIS